MTKKCKLLALGCAAIALALGSSSVAVATIPYKPVKGPIPGFGAGVITPDLVGGKEYSHDFDSTSVGGGAIGPPPFDAEQVIAWDGTPGASGADDVADYTGSRPMYTPDDEVDAIANRRDYGYEALKADAAHLVFSVDDTYGLYSFGGLAPAVLPSAGPVVLGNGNVIGGAGEYSVEESTAFGNPLDKQSLWAAQADVNAMPLPDDLDGVELWGPEPHGDPLVGDADKYSLMDDIFSAGLPGGAVSVWNASGTPYVSHAAVVAAVTSLLPGPVPSAGEFIEAINLDALMVHDVVGDPDRFDGDAAGGPGAADEIIFSIRQIPNPGDPDGYYATGSELFWLNASGAFGYLIHGGHPWDHGYALSTFNIWSKDPLNYGVIDINAIEAIGEYAVPEPTSMMLLLCGVAGLIRRRQR